MSILIDIAIVGVWCYGLAALSWLGYVKSVPLRHKVVNHKAEREAITLAENDRFIRDQEHELWPDRTDLNHRDCAICGPGPLKQGTVPSGYSHPFFAKVTETGDDGYGTWQVEALRATSAERAEMVSSKVMGEDGYTGKHTLMLDVDLPVTLVESTHAGHYHLYIDHLMTWRQYRGVLKAMAEAGLIEQEYHRAALRQGSTMLRPPWVKKPALDMWVSNKSLMREYFSTKPWDRQWIRNSWKDYR